MEPRSGLLAGADPELRDEPGSGPLAVYQLVWRGRGRAGAYAVAPHQRGGWHRLHPPGVEGPHVAEVGLPEEEVPRSL